MTPKQLLQSIPDDELQRATNECLEWQRTGNLPGITARGIADRMVSEAGLSEDGVLRDTDTFIMCEAARRFAALHNPAGDAQADAVEDLIFDKPSGDVRGTVVAFAYHKGKRKRIAHATLLVEKEPTITLEIPQNVQVSEIPVLSKILVEFAARVTRLNAE